MAQILKSAVVRGLMTGLAMFLLVWLLTGGAWPYMAVVIAFGIGSLVSLVTFGVMSIRWTMSQPLPPPPSPPLQTVAIPPLPAQPVLLAPPDYRGFLRDLAMAIACGIVVGLAVYLVMSQLVSEPVRPQHHEPQPVRIVPGIAGVLVFLGVFFRRLVQHMFPSSSRVPEARAIARRPAR